MYNGLAPLPAQRNLTPPPTLDPQQPVSSSDNYRYHRFSSPSLTDISSNRTSREHINVWYSGWDLQRGKHMLPWCWIPAGILNCVMPCLKHREGAKLVFFTNLIFIWSPTSNFFLFPLHIYSFKIYVIGLSRIHNMLIYYIETIYLFILFLIYSFITYAVEMRTMQNMLILHKQLFVWHVLWTWGICMLFDREASNPEWGWIQSGR